ncbi:MAG: threonylcarbamoyl-AMP synthase [Chitinophagaceae bacterium]|nr:threonylcarbamoyl-AMP synthase [Chitinophagaceae bacterium]
MQQKYSPLQIAASLLKQEEVVAIPTETVYGLAGNAFSEKAVSTIFELKNRPQTNPLIVHVANLKAVEPLVKKIPEKMQLLAAHFWPGPLTLLLDKSDKISSKITAGSNRVAIRVPAHPLAIELLNLLDFPLVAPSANPYTRISPTKAAHVEAYFGSKLKFILDGGDCTVGVESTIVGLENGKPVIFRKGMISKKELEELIGPTDDYIPKSPLMPTPGLALRHYAPVTETQICERENIARTYKNGMAVVVFKEKISTIPFEAQYILSKSGSLQEAAQQLYQTLTVIDQSGYNTIICEELPNEGVGIALNDRLKRASWKNSQT